ncbi:MAG: alginate export family protein [Planctomycetes bacterium]|nr:alginate export family protein [Planctomycetota bacterium]
MLISKYWLRRSLAVLGLSLGTGVASAQPPATLPIPDESPSVVASPGVDPSPPAPPPPIAPAAAPCAACDSGFNFKGVPPIRVPARQGMFAIAPSGPGYYSALDALRGEIREKPPQYGYLPFALKGQSYYDVDFSYLDDPKSPPPDWSERLKRMRIGDNWMFSTGGQAWYRYFSETNSRLTGKNNDYGQYRTRVYGDLWYKDFFRIYAEGIFSGTQGIDLPPLPIDTNQNDFLNLFIDLKIAEIADHPVYARVGRQEILLGSQRLVSPLEWANTRRTFQGARIMTTAEKFNFDAFWLQPVLPNAKGIDSVDTNVNFAGVWGTYKPKKGTAVDLYYLLFDNRATIVQSGINRAPNTVNTFGSRYVGDKDNRFLWDFEGALQLGQQGTHNLFAGMATAGLGYHPKDVAWNPTFWLYYDYASGDNNPNNGTFTTFNQLFPFGHYYLGWADVVGRQNIHDINASLTLYPAKWMTLWFQAHNFWLASSKDALYGPAGVALRRDPTGAAGNFVGNELDTIVNFHLNKRTDLLVSYSYLFAGEFLQKTQPAGSGSANTSTLAMIINYRW